MTEQELRALVREAIAKHGAIDRHGAAKPAEALPSGQGQGRQHASHSLIALPAGADGDGLCIIEPAVACNHCGYCKSLGH
jgi:hypothetical protein